MIRIREYREEDINAIQAIWNEVIEEGNSFFWTESFSLDKIRGILERQDAVLCAEDTENGEVAGFYILHKNFPGRGAHVANALYAVGSRFRNRRIGRTLAVHSLETAKRCGYRAIQFNSVVSSNTASVKLWESLGFERAGTIRKAFMNPMNQPLDIYIYYREL